VSLRSKSSNPFPATSHSLNRVIQGTSPTVFSFNNDAITIVDAIDIHESVVHP
jgi:hypothetical protein